MQLVLFESALCSDSRTLGALFGIPIFQPLGSDLPRRMQWVQGLMFDMCDSARDARSGDEWLLSVISYLQFRAGQGWRKLHRPGQRWHGVRMHYLRGVTLLLEVRYTNPPPCSCAAFCSVPKKSVSRARHLPIAKALAMGGGI